MNPRGFKGSDGVIRTYCLFWLVYRLKVMDVKIRLIFNEQIKNFVARNEGPL